jgi:uncharacterized protein involved in outer membrane biogenesis
MYFQSSIFKRWFKRLLWLCGVVLLLWGLGWLALPSLLKPQIETIASGQLGRAVTLGRLEIKPWSLELVLHGLSVAAAPGQADQTPQLVVERIYIDASLESLLRLAPVLDAIDVQGPALRLTHHGDGHYDIDDILQRFKSDSVPSANPSPGFSLHNVTLSAGRFDMDDRPVGRQHTVRELQLSLPFLSNLPSQRAVTVQPKLGFLLNGSRFESSAQATPFAPGRQAAVQLSLSGLDLAPWLPYVPAGLPVRLSSGVLSAQLQLAFEQVPANRLRISGTLEAAQVRLHDAQVPPKPSAAGVAPLLAFDRLKLTLDDLRPFERQVRLTAVELVAPRLALVRDATGQVLLPSSGPTSSTTKKIASNPGGKRAEADLSPPYGGWTIALDRFAVQDGGFSWLDQSTFAPARIALTGLTLDASAIALPFTQPMQLKATAGLLSGGSAAARAGGARLSLQGSATDRAVELRAVVDGLPLTLAAPYLARWLKPELTGRLNTELGVSWKAADSPTGVDQMQLDVARLAVDKLDLRQDKASLASLAQLRLAGLQLDLTGRSATLGKLAIQGPRLAVGRGVDGRWMFEHWLQPQPISDTAARTNGQAQTVASTPAPAAPPWSLLVRDLTLDGGAFGFYDKLPVRPVAFNVAAVSLQLKNLSTAGKDPMQLQGALQWQAGATPAGRLKWQGQARLDPLSVQTTLEAVRLPLHVLEPYAAELLNIEVLRADASFKGLLAYAPTPTGTSLQLNGDVALEDVQANSLSTAKSGSASASSPGFGEELLQWKVLSLRGLALAMAPGSATRVDVKETVLSDFYTRLVLDPTGRLNLQDVLKADAALPDAAKAASSAPAPATTAAAAPASADPPVVRLGPITLTGGRIDFADRFIKPNYSANLTELTGKLGAFSSQPQAGEPAMAELALRGRAQGTATLDIQGQINPLAKPLMLDLKARVRDLELPPLSAYAVRHAGHGIERGKLSVDLSYQVQADGQLLASNNIVLNQLKFGDKVDGAPTSLPVRLAVALLADRNGVIDIDLPVSGSLNDPEFKLGPIVFKLVVNLVVKAVTAPFSLIASAFGSAEEPGVVNFASGSAALDGESRASLDKVVKALQERPALQMTVVGMANLELEREAFKREQLNALVLGEQRREAVLAGRALQSPSGGASAPATLSPEESLALLRAVYRRAAIPKPLNAQGQLLPLSKDEMEHLLLSHLPASEDQMRELAVQRGLAVRDYLSARQIPMARLFLGAARTVPPEAKWRPRAQLSLSTP